MFLLIENFIPNRSVDSSNMSSECIFEKDILTCFQMMDPIIRTTFMPRWAYVYMTIRFFVYSVYSKNVFLFPDYFPICICQSTDVDRTLMSIAHNLAGMFPPTKKQVWNESIMWSAVPIHTVPEDMDYVLAMKKPCPLYEHAYEKYKKSNEIQSILKKHKSLLEYLEENSGRKIRKICKVWKFDYLSKRMKNYSSFFQLMI